MTEVMLTGYDAKRCARRVHNDWDPTIEKVAWDVPPTLQMRFDAGRAYENEVLARLVAALPEPPFDFRLRRDKQEAIDATLVAMDTGASVILGGWLPDDPVGGRTGRPDLLLRVDGGYLPGDVKAHKLLAKRKRGTASLATLADPVHPADVDGWGVNASARFDDYLQLAHYWRMLEALGRTTGAARGVIIGTDRVQQDAPAAVHLDLAAPLFETYSRSRGTAKRSALERYDHEHGFRVEVARAAAEGQVLVQPIFTDECESCPWSDFCHGQVEGDVASAAITSGRLSVREWRALAAQGVESLEDLADLTADDEAFLGDYLPEVTHVKDPRGRLGAAVRRARMARDGREIERQTTGPIEVPRADIEIDLDLEWDLDDRVYLWGVLIKRPGEVASYEPFVDFGHLDHEGAYALATRFAGWLRDEIARAEAAGHSLLVYHYAHPEPAYLKRIMGESEVADLTARFVDLLPIMRTHFFGLHGLGIKHVAPTFGATWDDDDPGGLQSQLWLLDARHADDGGVREAARERILTYNRDDVRATAAIRVGLAMPDTR